MTTVDLRRLGLRSGEELTEEHEVAIAPLELGGQRYAAVPENVPAELTVTQAANGTAFRLRSPCSCTARATAVSTTLPSTR